MKVQIMNTQLELLPLPRTAGGSTFGDGLRFVSEYLGLAGHELDLDKAQWLFDEASILCRNVRQFDPDGDFHVSYEMHLDFLDASVDVLLEPSCIRVFEHLHPTYAAQRNDCESVFSYLERTFNA